MLRVGRIGISLQKKIVLWLQLCPSSSVVSVSVEHNMSERLARVLGHLGGNASSSLVHPASLNANNTSGGCPFMNSFDPQLGHPAAIVGSSCPYLNSLPRAGAASTKKPMSVCVTGAAGNIGYSIVFMIAQGKMLEDTPIELRLLDIPPMMAALEGLKMEILDGAFPLITKIVCTADYKTAFTDLDIALLVGARPRGPGMQRSDLLKANASIFSGQGKALNAYAKKTVRVLVVGNPANTNALIAQQNAPDLPKTAFTAMTRLDQNRASSLLAEKIGVAVGQVSNVVIWGNHSSTQYPDVTYAKVADFPQKGHSSSLQAAVCDDNWLQGPFVKIVAERGAAVIKARGKSSAASAAAAAVDHMHDWVLGSKGQYVSMGVPSDGSYGVAPGLIFSYPVICSGGSYSIVQGLKLNAFSTKMINITMEELLDEKKAALG
eukprot:g43748.t1